MLLFYSESYVCPHLRFLGRIFQNVGFCITYHGTWCKNNRIRFLSEGRDLFGSHGWWRWIMAVAPGWPWTDLVRFNAICSGIWVGELHSHVLILAAFRVIYEGKIDQELKVSLHFRAEATSAKTCLTLWSRISCKYYLIIQSVPRRKHRTSPLKRSTG
jgi:hypothetical protein